MDRIVGKLFGYEILACKRHNGCNTWVPDNRHMHSVAGRLAIQVKVIMHPNMLVDTLWWSTVTRLEPFTAIVSVRKPWAALAMRMKSLTLTVLRLEGNPKRHGAAIKDYPYESPRQLSL